MTFPDDFRWGVSTAAYQIEGASNEGGRGRSDWDDFVDRPGSIFRGDTAEVAADHYHRFEEDLDLTAALGVDTYRLSISWSRVIPDGAGEVNEEGLAFYNRLIDAVVARGLTPLVTLNHMEVPSALAQAGGWLNRATIDAFVAYCDIVHAAFQDRVRHWSTLNEVNLGMWFGYGIGEYPPGRNDIRLVLPAVHHQMVAHARVVARLRRRQADGVFGIVGAYWALRAPVSSPENDKAIAFADLLFNRSTVDVLVTGAYPPALLEWHRSIGGEDFIQPGDLDDAAGSLDYYGLNYYCPFYLEADPEGRGGLIIPKGLGLRYVDVDAFPRSAYGWLIDPAGLREVLQLVHDRYHLPVWITENGGAFEDYVAPTGLVNDVDRIDYIQKHLEVVDTAIGDGIDVLGYCVWSLIDNFEWSQGYSKRFGLVFVDFGTQRRIPKASFSWYRDHIAEQRRTARLAGQRGMSPHSPPH